MNESKHTGIDTQRTLYAYLKGHCVGKLTSTWDLAKKATLPLDDNDLWAV